MKKTLSFVIPNYNNAKELNEALNSIYIFAKENLDFIEICISDNCSEDNSLNIIQKWKNKFKYFSYHINNKNIGFQRNILHASKMAKNNYIWFFSSDDTINNTQDFTFNMLQKILNSSTNMYILNRNICTYNMDIIKKENILTPNSIDIYNWKKPLSFSNYTNHANNVNAFGCFISSLILNKESMQKCISISEHDIFYKNNIFPHVYLIIKSLPFFKTYTVKYIDYPLVNFRSDNSSFIGDSPKYLLNTKQYTDLLKISDFIENKIQKKQFIEIVSKQFKNAVITNFQVEEYLENYIFSKTIFDEISNIITYKNIIKITSLIENIKNSKETYILYGLGSIGKLIFHSIKKNIIGIIDNSIHQNNYHGIEILPIEALKNFENKNVTILLTPMIHREIIIKKLNNYKIIIKEIY